MLVICALAAGVRLILKESKEIYVPVLLQSSPGQRQLITMDSFRFVRSEKGRITWRLDSRKADLAENKEATMEDIEINFSSADHREAKLFGDAGTMDTATGNTLIRRITHDVKIVTSDDYLLTTASLFWKAGERVVRTADPFRLIGTEIYLEGVGLTANVDLGTIVVKNNVKAVLQE
ncbi:MAG TPA: LPS export ABC transporter periplasmic protein LptC [Nitrospirota bacterium]|nr:LPS export ABC transporter periplasmic protein LptC [Nitrospirota bacterium]